MEFDLLVRKYLRGALSPPELERLRDMLERVPEYREELRQILDLRSMIDDDALRLIPPSELSERTRESVGAQFAGIESLLKHDASRLSTPGDLSDATRSAVGLLFASAASVASPIDASDTQEDREPKRRAVILPYRVVGRALLAASIAITIALAPTMLGPSFDDPTQSLASADTGPGVDLDSRARSGDGAGSAFGRTDRTTEGVVTGPSDALASTIVGETTALAAATRSEGSAGTTSRRDVSSAIAESVTSSDPSSDLIIEPASVDASTQSDAIAAIDPVVPLDPDNPLSRLLPSRLQLGDGRSYNPAMDSSTRVRTEPLPAIAAIAIPGVVDDGRLLSVGVTLGSGNVMDADAPAALMQNSYYFSFSVSGSDRIGVEMGGSTFLQETQVPDKRPVGNIFAKLDIGDSTGGYQFGPGTVAAPTVAQRVKQDITYGGVFYDRRLEIENDWDVCGRVTFGAADGALVAGVRAYTAYSPTPSVTLTLGIGGSKLFDLKGHDDDGSTNYGLYYGIETGF